MKPLLTLAEQATVRMAKAERKLAKAEAKLLRTEAKLETRKAKVAAAQQICEAAANEVKQCAAPSNYGWLPATAATIFLRLQKDLKVLRERFNIT